MSNPFKLRLERAKMRLRTLEAQWKRHNDNAMPGPFETGNSGIPASRRRKLDRQLDRTIDLSVALVDARKKVAVLQAQHDAYERGEINAQGRAIRPKIKESQRLPEFERVEDRIFVADLGGGPTWSDRKVRPNQDYKPIVTLNSYTLEPHWYKGDFPEDLLEVVRRQVEDERRRLLATRQAANNGS